MFRAPIRSRHLCAIVLAAALGMAASGTHVVRSGETLDAIARRNGTSVRELVAANGIADPNRILVGQTLKIPGTGAPAPAAPSTSTHVVRVGESLSTIARLYRTTVAAIAAANGIADPNRIVAGRALAITAAAPAAAGAPAPTSSPTGGAGRPGQRHTVAVGETISGIAARYGLTTAQLVAWNGLVDGKLYATARLVLFDPGRLPGAGPSTGPTTHQVGVGETLSSIASRYNTTVSAIVTASRLADPNRIVRGQSLTIPGGGSGASARCPVPGGTFFNDWGFPRSGGRAHAGNDIFAPRGTPVVAPVAGTVDHAEGSIGGKQFRLTAADGSRWYGSHLDAFGERGAVQAGTVIGYVGDSGNARGSRPHLHFEVHPAGTPVNPFPLLRAAC